MIYQFEHEKIKLCEDCKLCDLNFDWCNMQRCLINKYQSPKFNNCPLVAISKKETTSCENGKTKTERKYDNFRSYNIQGDCYKYVCSCIGCGQVLWEIEDYNYMKGERGCKPPFCQKCGRRLEETARDLRRGVKKMSKAKTSIDRFIAANVSAHEELENLVNIFYDYLIFCGGINKNSVQIYSGIDKLAKEIGVETKEILYDGEQPRKVFKYKGMEFFQVGDIDYKSVRVEYK